MGFLLVISGVIALACIILFVSLWVSDEFSVSAFVVSILFIIIAIFSGMMENKAKNSCVVSVLEYKRFKLEKVNVSCEKAMIVRETFYDYPGYSVFYEDRREYEILRIEE